MHLSAPRCEPDFIEMATAAGAPPVSQVDAPGTFPDGASHLVRLGQSAIATVL